jgi:formate dehydrogenase subunit delta
MPRGFAHRGRPPVNVDNLVKMANDIAAFFASESDREKAKGDVASHLRRFWDPRMRKEIIRHAQGGGVGLSDLALDAVRILTK